MNNELIKLVESANKNLQEKELTLIKKEGQKLLTEMKESVSKMDEIAISRMASRLAPTSRDKKRREIEKMIASGVDPASNMELLKSMDQEDQEYSGGSGLPSATSFRRGAAKVAQRDFKAPPVEGIANQIKDLELKLAMSKSKEEGDRILSQIKYLKSQMETPETKEPETMEKDPGMIMQRAMGDKFQP
jgi:hypothetical protein